MWLTRPSSSPTCTCRQISSTASTSSHRLKNAPCLGAAHSHSRVSTTPKQSEAREVQVSDAAGLHKLCQAGVHTGPNAVLLSPLCSWLSPSTQQRPCRG